MPWRKKPAALAAITPAVVLIQANDTVTNTYLSSKCTQLSSAKAEWLANSGRSKWPQRCSIKGCGLPPTVGGHVYLNGDTQTFWLIPICDHHNAEDRKGVVQRKVKARTKAVQDVTMTCACILDQLSRLRIK
jgi:hypothetical protein